MRLLQHRRGPAPVRRPGRRRGLPLHPVRDGRRPAGLRLLRPARPQGRLHASTSRRPTHWQVVSNTPTPAPVAGRAQASPAGTSPTTARMSHLHHRPRRRALPRGPRRVHRAARHLPAGRLLPRASLAPYLDADEILDGDQAGLRVLRGRSSATPYPFGKYDQLFVPEFNAGAMENAGCVTLIEDYVFRSRVTDVAYESRANTILHELAHMWFGDLVTMRWWDDLWLNESFAEWASHHAIAKATRYTDAWTGVRQPAQDLGLPPGPAALDPPDRRRHARPRDGRSSTSTASPTPRAPPPFASSSPGSARRSSSPGCAPTSSSTRGATPTCATCSSSWRRPAAATCRPGRGSGCRPRA